MRAVTFSTGEYASVKMILLPELRPTYLLIKVESVALNPTDWKCISWLPSASHFSIVGIVICDYAGAVVSVGSEVTKSFKIGDSNAGQQTQYSLQASSLSHVELSSRVI